MNRSWRLHGLTGLLWLFITVIATPRLLNVLVATAPIGLRLIWGAMIVFLNWFWLCSAHHIISFCITRLMPTSPQFTQDQTGLEAMPKVRVAILYLTCDDLDEECLESCFHSGCSNVHVFICDDSVSKTTQEKIDAFQVRHARACTVFRRSDRKGFKAGNINYALRRLDLSFTHLILLDSDSRLAPDLIPVAMSAFNADRRIGFIQSIHRAVPATTQFESELSFGFEELWKCLLLKNQFGFVQCFGHGVVVRRDLLEAIGGVPEVVSEDLMMAVKFGERGYSGLMTSEAVCAESVPRSLEQLRRRHEKWMIGLLESRHSLIASIFDRTNKLSMLQRIDLSFSCLNLFGLFPFLLFLVSMNIVTPLIFGVWKPITIFGGVELHSLTLSPFFIMPITDDWRLHCVSLIVALAPLMYFAPLFMCHPRRCIRYVATSYACFCSSLAPAISTLIAYIGCGHSWFRPTHRDDEAELISTLTIWERFQVGRDLSLALEVVWAIGSFAVAIATANIFLLSFAVGALTGPCARFFQWDGKAIQALKYIPFALILAQLLRFFLPTTTMASPFNQLSLIHF